MKLLVLQHETVEHPGIFRRFLAEDGHTYDAVELQLGEAPPALDGYDALWVLGGPMDVWQEDQHPWLKPEKGLIRQAVEAGMPYLGLCLGHQLLAEAMGGAVGPSKTPEIGVMPVEATQSGGLFQDIPTSFDVLQWHSAEVTRMPPGANILAKSDACAVQAMSVGPRAFSAQFHLEVEPETVQAWAAIPEYAAALEKAMGPGAVAKLDAAAAEKMHAFETTALQFYRNWMSIAATEAAL